MKRGVAGHLVELAASVSVPCITGAMSGPRNDTLKGEDETILREAYARRGLPVPEDPAAAIPPPRTELETRLEWSRRAAWNGFPRSAGKHAYAAVRMAEEG